jgi:hypothetical protein
MGEESHSADPGSVLPDAGPVDRVTDPASVERRVWRNIVIVIVVAVAATAVLADIKFAVGLAVGGCLALFNYRWLSASVRAILDAGEEKAPPGTSLKFLFRWVVIGFAVYVLTRTGYVDVVAVLAGLFAPGAAIMMEAAYVTYKTLANGGER